MIEQIKHYAFTNPASVHDEEALTALELVGRLGAKVNELIIDSNKFEGMLPQLVADWLEAHPEITTTIQDGEITENKIFSDFLFKLLNYNEVSIKSFGAVGDGVTDDTKSIQDAIDFMYKLGGGVVVVPPSKLPYIFTTICVKENVTLEGRGGVLKLQDYYCKNEATSYYLLHNMGEERVYNNVSYINLIIDGNGENNTHYKVADAITAVGKNVIVKGCKITNPPDSGIMYSQAEGSICEGNIISGAPDCGIYINNNGATELKMGSSCDNNVITDCYTAIAMKRIVQHMSVRNNTIKRCEFGITHEHASSDRDFATETIITGNMMIDLTHTGIILRGSNHCVVSSNKIDGFVYRGILIEGSRYNTITGNTIKATIETLNFHRAAISLCHRSVVGLTSAYNVISNNVCDITNNNTSEYRVSYVELVGESVTYPTYYNIISNNVFNGVNMHSGIFMEWAINNQISDNIIFGASYAFIQSTDNGYNVMRGNQYQGSMTNVFLCPVVTKLPSGVEVYQNITNVTPNFTPEQNTICLAKEPTSIGYMGWVMTPTGWQLFGKIGE